MARNGTAKLGQPPGLPVRPAGVEAPPGRMYVGVSRAPIDAASFLAPISPRTNSGASAGPTPSPSPAPSASAVSWVTGPTLPLLPPRPGTPSFSVSSVTAGTSAGEDEERGGIAPADQQAPPSRVQISHRGSPFSQFSLPPDLAAADLSRAALEDTVEELFFSEEGKGEIHVLVADRIKVPVGAKNKREERTLAIARDWCGAFALLVMSGAKKKLKIEGSYPLLDGFMVECADGSGIPAQFSMAAAAAMALGGTNSPNPMMAAGGSVMGLPLSTGASVMSEVPSDEEDGPPPPPGSLVRFLLNVDDMRWEAEATTRARDRLLRGLQWSFAWMEAHAPTKAARILQRVACVEFASLFDPPSPESQANPDRLLQACLAQPPPTAPPRARLDALTRLRKACVPSLSRTLPWPRSVAHPWLCLVGPPRQRITEGILAAMKPPQSSAQLWRILDCVEQLLKVLTRPPATAASFSERFQRAIAAMGTLEGHIAQRAAELVEDLNAAEAAWVTWQGRQALNDVPFEDWFLAPDKRGQQQPVKDKRMQPFVKYGWKEGTYLAVVMYSTRDRQILVDANGVLPSVCIQEQTPGMLPNGQQHPDMLWALQYGMQDEGDLPVKKEKDLPKEPFRVAFKQGVALLRQRLATRNIGALYDQPIFMPTTNSLVFFTVRGLSEAVRVGAKEKFEWAAGLPLEHLLYQYYMGISKMARLEHLSTHFIKGNRFIETLIQYQTAVADPLPRGVHVALVNFLSDLNGIQVLSRERERWCVPTVLVQRQPITAQEWAWVQSIPLRAKQGLPLVDEGREGKDTFETRFLRAVGQLKSELGLADLGCVYDRELLAVDERDSIFVIPFVAQSESRDLPAGLADQYLWRPLECFEVLHSLVFLPTLYGAYLGRVGALTETLLSLADQDGSRREIEGRLEGLEKMWSPMQWLMRLFAWASSGLQPLVDLSPNQAGRNPYDVVAEVAPLAAAVNTLAILRNAMVEARNRPWDELERAVQRVELTMEQQLRKPEVQAVALHVEDVQPFVPFPGDPEELKASTVPPMESVRVTFGLADLLQPTHTEQAETEIMCDLLVNQLVEDVLVRAVDHPELSAVEDAVRSMVEVVECIDDLVQEVSWQELRRDTEEKLDEDRRRFAEELERLFGQPLPTFDLANDHPPVQVGDSEVILDDLTSPFAASIRALALDFSSLVQAILETTDIADTVVDLAEVVDHVRDLSRTAAQRCRATQRHMHPQPQPSQPPSHPPRNRGHSRKHADLGPRNTDRSEAQPSQVAISLPELVEQHLMQQQQQQQQDQEQPGQEQQMIEAQEEELSAARRTMPSSLGGELAPQSEGQEGLGQSTNAIVTAMHKQRRRQASLARKNRDYLASIRKGGAASPRASKQLPGNMSQRAALLPAPSVQSDEAPLTNRSAASTVQEVCAPGAFSTLCHATAAAPGRTLSETGTKSRPRGIRSKSPSDKQPHGVNISRGFEVRPEDDAEGWVRLMGGDGSICELSRAQGALCRHQMPLPHPGARWECPTLGASTLGLVGAYLAWLLPSPAQRSQLQQLIRAEGLPDEAPLPPQPLPPEVAAVLGSAPGTENELWLLFEAADMLQIPGLLLGCASAAARVAETEPPPKEDMTGASEARLRRALLDCFLMGWEAGALADACAAAQPAVEAFVEDTLWYGRFYNDLERAESDEGPIPDSVTLIARHRGRWKAEYAEVRISSQLVGSVDDLEEEELALWARHLGPAVRHLDLRGVPDGSVLAVVSETCPGLTSIDLTGIRKGLTDDLIAQLVDAAPNLRLLKLTGSNLGPGSEIVGLIPSVAPDLVVQV
ncbi:putative heterotrimeric G-protein [Paratrimastix pyriformis]|uniref:Heterotrimeric G-protein n=1 Tax=Paratrimastix pyriformis TaxID=342808 RepID=A0ABQ8UWC7_9EUKA|nr:putative heterotrimeric G-protein [Paratrimastix pyriformis]